MSALGAPTATLQLLVLLLLLLRLLLRLLLSWWSSGFCYLHRRSLVCMHTGLKSMRRCGTRTMGRSWLGDRQCTGRSSCEPGQLEHCVRKLVHLARLGPAQ